jgi:hypothetical protein
MDKLLPNTPLGDVLESQGVKDNPAQKLFHLMYDEECKEDPDCDEIECECGGMFETVFGSLPLLVKCIDCEKEFVLRDLVLEL